MPTHVDILINEDTLQTRYCYSEVEPPRFHEGFSNADHDAGWRRALTLCAAEVTGAQLQLELVNARARLQGYWQELAERAPEARVVANGRHYTIHPLGEGVGFGGRAFEVRRRGESQAPFVCNLSAQGKVPAWIRAQLPDSADIAELDDSAALRTLAGHPR